MSERYESHPGEECSPRGGIRIPVHGVIIAAVPLLLSVWTGCGDDDDEAPSDSTQSTPTQEAAGTGGAGQGAAGEAAAAGSSAGSGGAPVYSFTQVIQSGEEYLSYVTLTNTTALTPDSTELSPDKAREFANGIWVAGGHVIEIKGAELTAWQAGDDLSLSEGPTLSFAQYPLTEEGADPFNQWIVDDHTAYLVYDFTSRIVWDPTDFKIITDRQDTKLEPTFEGLQIDAAGNRGELKAVDGKPTQMAYFYRDEDWWRFASKSVIAFYDPETHNETKLIDVPCPGLAVASRDEDGYTYWGAWDYKHLVYQFGQGAEPCIARITPDGELDESFTTSLTDLTGGLYGKKFLYIRDGWALMFIIDTTSWGLDFSKPPTAADDLPTRWWAAENSRVWKIDLKNKKAEPWDQLDPAKIGFNVADFIINHVDGRTFVEVWHDDWSTSTIFELHDDDTLTEYNATYSRWALVR